MINDHDSITNREPQPLRFITAPDESAAADFAWFAENPDRHYRARLANGAELRELRRIGDAPPAELRLATAIRHLPKSGVLLYELGPISAAWRDPADLDETGAEALFQFLMGRSARRA